MPNVNGKKFAYTKKGKAAAKKEAAKTNKNVVVRNPYMKRKNGYRYEQYICNWLTSHRVNPRIVHWPSDRRVIRFPLSADTKY